MDAKFDDFLLRDFLREKLTVNVLIEWFKKTNGNDNTIRSNRNDFSREYNIYI